MYVILNLTSFKTSVIVPEINRTICFYKTTEVLKLKMLTKKKLVYCVRRAYFFSKDDPIINVMRSWNHRLISCQKALNISYFSQTIFRRFLLLLSFLMSTQTALLVGRSVKLLNFGSINVSIGNACKNMQRIHIEVRTLRK